MSRGNVEIICAAYEAWSDGHLDAWLEMCDPEVELLTSGYFPDLAPVYRGYDGMRAFWDELRAPWEWFHLEPEKIVEGEDRAAVAINFRARGTGSGVITDLHQGHAHLLRNGRFVKVSPHPSFEEAIEAVGLRA
jgi:ketosteroid isomerase-like protein